MMAQVYGKQMKDEKEVEYNERALLLSREIYDSGMTWQFQHLLGQEANLKGQLEKAKSYYSEAINTIESIREKISVEEYKIGFMGVGNKLVAYDDMILLLLQLKEDGEAFSYVERAKSRALLDLLGNRIILEKGKDKEPSQEEMRLRQKINELLEKIQIEQSQSKGKQRDPLNVWNEELKKTRKKYSELLLKLKRNNPELYSLVSVNPLTLKEIQEFIGHDTTLLEYYAFPQIDSVVYWVTNKSEYRVISQNVSNLASKIATFREKIATLQPDYKKDGEYLYDLLIRPAKSYIKTKRICIIPHSVLHYLPFQALINGDGGTDQTENQSRFLIEEYDIFYSPSASVLKFVLEKRKEHSDKILAFGNPDLGDENLNLPYAEEEVMKIKENYPDTSLFLNEGCYRRESKTVVR